MTNPATLDPDAFYDDAAIHRVLGLRYAAMERARKRGELRFTRRGGKLLYLGSWVTAWLTGDGTPATAEARSEAVA